jgi:hypothetical protein
MTTDSLDLVALLAEYPALENLRLAAETAAIRAEEAWVASALANGAYLDTARILAGLD